jgi:FdrA protein
LISVPGRYAAGVAREALLLGRNVFLYSDNVSLEDEIKLKQTAQQKQLLVMGPDCGTAIINGACLGFANRVRRGSIGVIGASGTGLQAVVARIHTLGLGVSQVIGTGTHDLSDAVGATTTRQALALLTRDPATDVIVLVSKPPSHAIAAKVLEAAQKSNKPVVVDFIGYTCKPSRNLHPARTLSEAAEKAVALTLNAETEEQTVSRTPPLAIPLSIFMTGQRYLRGLYSGGTLAYEAQLLLRDYLGDVYSNAPLERNHRLSSSAISQGHTIIDLGADEFTLGRLHPMLDNDLRIRRLRQEADDPSVAIILLDIVLGYGTHPDPASELAPVIAEIREKARAAGRYLETIVVVVGTEEDPQNLPVQLARLQDAGARVEMDHAAAVEYAGRLGKGLGSSAPPSTFPEPISSPAQELVFQDPNSPMAVSPEVLQQPFAAINLGLESFYASMRQQGLPVIHVDWRPPARGDEKLMAILERLKRKA